MMSEKVKCPKCDSIETRKASREIIREVEKHFGEINAHTKTTTVKS